MVLSLDRVGRSRQTQTSRVSGFLGSRDATLIVASMATFGTKDADVAFRVVPVAGRRPALIAGERHGGSTWFGALLPDR